MLLFIANRVDRNMYELPWACSLANEPSKLFHVFLYTGTVDNGGGVYFSIAHCVSIWAEEKIWLSD